MKPGSLRNATICAILPDVARRKVGAVLPIEVAILETALALRRSGIDAFHGFLLAKTMRDREGARVLIAHGTLYRALRRMEAAGWLESEWEEPAAAQHEGRPRRRLYRVTTSGRLALAAGAAPAPIRSPRVIEGLT